MIDNVFKEVTTEGDVLEQLHITLEERTTLEKGNVDWLKMWSYP